MGGSMFFRQYDLDCLSQYSYLIGDTGTGRAVVVDPQRDISRYLADAKEYGLVIERVIETHFHADFLSGHLELADATGAVISYGDAARPDFALEPLADGQQLSLGDTTLEILHTPGHTPESISIVVRQHPAGEPWAVLTGDTLFLGDVGRPDLLTSVGRSADSLARDLHRSLRTKLLTLPDGTLVYPAHGAGSACGKELAPLPFSTIGDQRSTNYALAPMTEDRFVEVVTEDQRIPPPYFAFAADANRRERALLDDHEPPVPLDLETAIELAVRGAELVDTRSPDSFAAGHVRGSVNVGLEGRFAECAGDVVRPGTPIVLLGNPGQALEAKVRLARIGFDAVVGAVEDVEDALAARPELATSASRLQAVDLAAWLAEAPEVQVVDVRDPAEIRAGGSVPGARNVPLQQLLERLDELDRAAPTVVLCAAGYRSSVAASALRARGFTSVADLLGGYTAWSSAIGATSVAG